MNAVIAGFARTPFVRFSGQFAGVSAVQLGAHAAAAALARAGVDPAQVDRVIAGQVLQAGAGQNPARQSAVAAGIPLTVPAVTVNVVCLSGSEAIAAAAQCIDVGGAEVVVAIGQESMSQAPHVAGLRSAHRFGAVEFVDSVECDGLSDAFEHRSMGASTEVGNRDLHLTREDQDAWAVQSHARAAAAADFLAGEIAPFVVETKRGAVTVAADDGVRPGTTVEVLQRLRPAFDQAGTITAGNASQITDGAAAVVLVSEEFARRQGISGVAVVESAALVAGPDVRLHAQPANAIARALEGTGIGVGDLVAVEINEAFASVVLHSVELLGVDPGIVNPHGGAIALGHPIGASGARLVGTLARQLHECGGGSVGAVGVCGGGGQGSAVLLRALP